MEGFFGLNIKHVGRGDIEINLPTAEAVIAAFQETGRVWEEWADMQLNQRQIKYLVDESANYGLSGRRAMEEHATRFTSCETLWDLYNAFTYVITHASNRLQETSRLNRFDRLNIMINSFLKETGESGLTAREALL